MTQQTQSSLNRVSRLPQGKRVREPQIELKDGTQLPALVSLTPHTPVSRPATRFRVAIPEPFKRILEKV
jgi:hypothetical protein